MGTSLTKLVESTWKKRSCPTLSQGHLTQRSRQLPQSDEGLQGDATAFPVAIVRDLEDESAGVRSAVTECAAISALATLGHAAAASRTRSMARTVTIKFEVLGWMSHRLENI